MTQARSVDAVRSPRRDLIGDLETRNALGEPIDMRFDPFLILGHHGPQTFAPNNNGMPFKDHPHRGFETVTFVLEGSLVHSDSAGHNRVVGRGGVQWMTAGAGLVHNEQVPPDFLQAGGLLEVIQLWINLPARLKMTTPRYVGVQGEAVPAVPLDERAGTLHLVSGTFGETPGPIDSITGVFMSSVDLVAGGKARLPAPRGRTILLYVVRGDVHIADRSATGGDIVSFADDGETFEITASSDALFLFGHAEPIGEPVVSRGPFVMNTDDEIDAAFRDYRAGAFGQPPASYEIG